MTIQQPGANVLLDDLSCKKSFSSIEEINEIVEPIMQSIAAVVGSHCEVVLHDLSRSDMQHTIYAIVNGSVTGRTVNGPSTNLGLDVLQDENANHDKFGYYARTSDGRELRSSSVYFRNSDGIVIAALCINYDLTPIQQLRSYVDELLPQLDSHREKEFIELISPDIETVLEQLISETMKAIGKPVTMMDKSDRVRAISMLDAHGAFHVKKSVELVAKRLGISKVTAYSYLDESRGENYHE